MTSDPAFPRLHGRPPTGWLNDPNGCSLIDGTWHVYYQYNPSAPVHANVHWGHMSSPDLLTWTTEPVALAPRPGEVDAVGCWSGCLIDDDGVPTAVFTGIDGDGRPSTVLARSDRSARVFTRNEPPAAGAANDPAITELRDPFLFSVDGRRLAVQGAGSPDGVGQVLLYDATDLTRWTELGTLLRADHPALSETARANILECPSIVEVDGSWVILASIWRSLDGQADLNQVEWIIGDLVPQGDSFRFEPRANGALDSGDAYYAAQPLALPDRTLVWGWAWETDHGSDRHRNATWQGVLTYARELGVADDRVVVRPAAELVGLRAGAADLEQLPAAFEILADGGCSLTLDGAAVGPQDGTVVRAFVDASMVELFTADGRSVTTRAYPGAGARWQVAAAGAVQAFTLSAPVSGSGA